MGDMAKQDKEQGDCAGGEPQGFDGGAEGVCDQVHTIEAALELRKSLVVARREGKPCPVVADEFEQMNMQRLESDVRRLRGVMKSMIRGR